VITIRIIPKHLIEENWPQIKAWVKSSLGQDKSYTPDDVKKACEESLILILIYKELQLKGFLVLSISQAPQGRVAYAPWLGGEDLGEWVQSVFEQLKRWLKEQGCIQYSWVGRKAWQKLVRADSEQCFYSLSL
jgi:hypothetical protein